MKNLFATIIVMLCAVFAQAQNYVVLHIEEVSNGQYYYCASEYDGVIIYAHDCGFFEWNISYDDGTGEYYQNLDSIVISNELSHVGVHYTGCGLSRGLSIFFLESEVENPFSEPIVWKRQGESITLFAESYGYSITWSTGETTNEIQVTDPGIYSVTIVDTEFAGCVNQTFSVEVRDNVEASLATTDLATNLNVVTWQTTDEQAEYVSQVKVYRDGALVGTAPYADGSFTDNIGSEAASRTYTVLAIAPDGTDCPILSHPKETIHMTYTLGVGNTIVIGWNHPTGYDLMGYNICEWHPGAKDDELTVIDYVGAGVSSYTCSESQFDHGMIVVQGVERTKDAESRLLSNRSLDYVGLGEKENKIFNLYPNPTTGRVTIEGTGRLTITNTLGQTVLTRDITDTETIDLPRGVWFVKLDGTTRKVVVE